MKKIQADVRSFKAEFRGCGGLCTQSKKPNRGRNVALDSAGVNWGSVVSYHQTEHTEEEHRGTDERAK